MSFSWVLLCLYNNLEHFMPYASLSVSLVQLSLFRATRFQFLQTQAELAFSYRRLSSSHMPQIAKTIVIDRI